MLVQQVIEQQRINTLRAFDGLNFSVNMKHLEGDQKNKIVKLFGGCDTIVKNTSLTSAQMLDEYSVLKALTYHNQHLNGLWMKVWYKTGEIPRESPVTSPNTQSYWTVFASTTIRTLLRKR